MSYPATKPEAATAAVAICGNPNSGKTTIFNAMTGLRQQVGNYPGVTVERTTGVFRVDGHSERQFVLMDVPGAYSLAAYSPDEYIAARALFGAFNQDRPPDVIVCVIDATNLERGLYLLFQVMQIGRPIVVALNMIDLAARQGITINAELLSEKLSGIAVIPVVGSRREGIERLKAAIAEADVRPVPENSIAYPPEAEKAIADLMAACSNGHRTRAEYFRILFDTDGPAERAFIRDQGGEARTELEEHRTELINRFGSLSASETSGLIAKAGELSAEVIQHSPTPARTTTEKIDRIVLHPILGPVILLALVTLIFQSIFSWSEPLMRAIDSLFTSISNLVGGHLPEGPVNSLLTDGVIGGVGSVLMFLPQIVILFMFISILEDSGYLPRMAFLVDRVFGWCGLSGKSFIPLLSSFACAVPGIMATRTIEDRKLRFITILVAPLMTCSARLPVYAVMIAAFIPHKTYLGFLNSQGLLLGALYALGLVVAVIVSLVLKGVLHRSRRGTFLMELPTYKLPTPQSIGIRVYYRARAFVIRAGTVILAITIIIWALSYYPHSATTVSMSETPTAQTQISDAPARYANSVAGEQLRNSYFGRLGKFVEPVFAPLGWDWKVTMAVLASFPAREVIIATLGTVYNLGSDVDQDSSSLVEKLRQARWDTGPKMGRLVFNPAVALSIMVFFALCCQCGATVVTIRQETGAWKYAAVTFTYMTIMAYFAAMITYQVAVRLVV